VRRLIPVVAVLTALIPIGAAAAQPHGGTAPSVTGGGIYDRAECAVNFSLNARTTPNGVTGEQNAVMSNAPGAIAGCPGQGHVKATVTCVAVNGHDAEIRGIITKQSGSFGPDFFPPGDTVFVTDVQDNGSPSDGTPDTIVQYVDGAGTENSCQAPSGDQLFTVDNGNVTVRG
jgi:hypothetical protein